MSTIFFKFLERIMDTDVLKIIGVLTFGFGLVTAYWKYIKGRIYHLRLEPAVEGVMQAAGGITYLTATLRLKNAGISQAVIRKVGTNLDVYTAESPTILPRVRNLKWNHITTNQDIFQNHSFIESGETVVEEILLALPTPDYFAIKLDLYVVAEKNPLEFWVKRREWNTMTIIHCTELQDAKKSND